MIIKNNDAGIFIRKWQEEVQKMMRNGIKKIPESPGGGWLAKIAAQHDMCCSTWIENGEWAVCAASLKRYPSENPYYCAGCYRKIKEHVDSLRKKQKQESAEPMKPFVKKVMPVEEDLPF